MSTLPRSLVWLRRDLRLHDHAALHEALQSEGVIQPVFIFDRDILARFSNPRDKRLSFLAQTLVQLHQQLQRHGGGLLIAYGRAEALIPELAGRLGAYQLVCEADYEPATRARDDAVRRALPEHTRMVQVVDHVICPPEKVIKDDGEPYKVFTPYAKRWRQACNQYSFAERPVALAERLISPPAVALASEGVMLNPDDGAAAMLEAMGYEAVDTDPWQVDDAADRLRTFTRARLDAYHNCRDMLAEDGTSRLSPYLRFGLISVRECARTAGAQASKGSDAWLNELIWRDFYTMILYHFPDSVQQEFQAQYRGLPWQQDEAAFARWQEGRTGFPIIDAAMRQLREIGWMHNRARMIVASFLTKDLQLDWRLGEEHFAQYLMDYELSSNVGGWQWAASTGTDAQPYFRIFNPFRQSERFDPQGEYIRRYVPELQALSAGQIHAPHAAKDLFNKPDYPEPMVDHARAKDQALALFKSQKAS